MHGGIQAARNPNKHTRRKGEGIAPSRNGQTRAGSTRPRLSPRLSVG